MKININLYIIYFQALTKIFGIDYFGIERLAIFTFGSSRCAILVFTLNIFIRESEYRLFALLMIPVLISVFDYFTAIRHVDVDTVNKFYDKIEFKLPYQIASLLIVISAGIILAKYIILT
jgi:hypothetical protein